MNLNKMTSMQRVLTTLGHKEPDRIPLFLLLTMHGAKELGLSIKDYFSKAENVVEGQLKLRKKYRNDCIYNFFYAPVEIEAWEVTLFTMKMVLQTPAPLSSKTCKTYKI